MLPRRQSAAVPVESTMNLLVPRRQSAAAALVESTMNLWFLGGNPPLPNPAPRQGTPNRCAAETSR